jgi:hypothetical protein
MSHASIDFEDLSRPKPLRRTIDSLDLALQDFATTPGDSGQYEFEATTGNGEYLHWRGIVSVSPILSAGLLEIRNIRLPSAVEFVAHRVNFGVRSGVVDVRAEYLLDASGETTAFTIRNGGVSVRNLELTNPGDSLMPVPVALPGVDVSGISFDYPANTLVLSTISIDGGTLQAAYNPDGTMTLQELLTPVSSEAETTSTSFRLNIGRITTEGLTFEFSERMQDPAAQFAFSDLDVTLEGLVYGMPGTARLTGAGVMNGGGSFRATGTLSMEPKAVELDLKVDKTPLASFQPYAARYSRAVINSGEISLKGGMKYGSRNEQPVLTFHGDASLNRVRVSDPVLGEDLTRWDGMKLRKVMYVNNPPSLSITEIITVRPYTRMIIGPDRMTNIQHAVGATDSTAAPEHVEEGPKTATTVGTITIVDGSMNFSDLSLTPNFVVGIQEMNGSIRGLSSEQLARADVDILGKVDKYAPVTIRGQINPLSEEAFTDVLMKFEAIDLTTFTPYFAKFAGYKIDRGKLNLDLRYKLNDRYLEGENKIVLQQLTLGEPVDGPDVTSLPVKLAIALLKDSHGVIDLDIPISGSLDDPEFSIFPIVLQVLMNLLWKIVTAPFALLGALFGGGDEDLQYVAFAPGLDSLSAEEQNKLVTVAKGLNERPELQIDIRGSGSRVADGEAMAEHRLMAAIAKKTPRPFTGPEADRLLEMYREKFSEDPELLVPEGTMEDEEREEAMIDAAWRRLLAAVEIPEEQIRALAQRRSAAIQDKLVTVGALDPSRIFLQEVDLSVAPTEGVIRTQMNLTAR